LTAGASDWRCISLRQAVLDVFWHVSPSHPEPRVAPHHFFCPLSGRVWAFFGMFCLAKAAWFPPLWRKLRTLDCGGEVNTSASYCKPSVSRDIPQERNCTADCRQCDVWHLGIRQCYTLRVQSVQCNSSAIGANISVTMT
jgi:hypothetical protein